MFFLERRCPVCNRIARAICLDCLQRFDKCKSQIKLQNINKFYSLFKYKGDVRSAILGAKNAGRVDICKQFGFLLSNEFCDLISFDLVVTWVPSSWNGYKNRGYDQSKVIAQYFAKNLNLDIKKMLYRSSEIRQVGKARFQRLAGPDLLVKANVPSKILLIDDVVTTGSSMKKASFVLKRSGAQEVYALSVAYVDH